MARGADGTTRCDRFTPDTALKVDSRGLKRLSGNRFDRMWGVSLRPLIRLVASARRYAAGPKCGPISIEPLVNRPAARKVTRFSMPQGRHEDEGEHAVVKPFDSESNADAGRRRLLGRKRSAALREVEALLAGCEELRDVTAEDVAAANARQGVTVDRRYRVVCRELYRRFFEQCLEDHRLSGSERGDLAHLKNILGLDAEDVATVHDEVSRAVYGQAVEGVLEDHLVDPEEADFLRQLREELELADHIAESLYETEERRARHRYFSKTVSADSTLLASHVATLELSGRSKKGVEEAVIDALEEACRAVPELASAELSQVRVKVRDGKVTEWEVDLKARLDRSGRRD